MVADRGWGMWTAIKLRALEDYLHRFTIASKRSTAVVYLDLFAGRPRNFVRTTGDVIDGSPLIALRTAPPFTHLAFCELPANAAGLDRELRVALPGDNRFRVYPGDCNQTVHQVLADLQPVRWAPTFAFVDPDGPDCWWSTLEALAQHKPPTSRSKVEMWILFPTMFMRELPVKAAGGPTAENRRRITAMYGTDQWELIYEQRLDHDIDGATARSEYVNLMRWRLQHTLGYKATHAIDVPNEQGRPIYTMIFATDHPAGERIMSTVYKHTARAFPEMRVQAQAIKAQKKTADANLATQMTFLDGDELSPANLARLELGDYQHVEPWPPPGTIDVS